VALLPELSQAVRVLRRSPLFAAVATFTLALGIGAMAAVFSVVDAVVLRPLPYSSPEQLVAIHHTLPGIGIASAEQSLGTYFHYQRSSRLLASIGAYSPQSVNLADAAGTAEPERVVAAQISASLLPTLGVAPLVGRGFTPEEDKPNGPTVALIGEGLWRRRLGGDAGIVGRSIQVNGTAYQVIGVMREDFRFPTAATQLWFPLALDAADPYAGPFRIAAVGRMRPSVTTAALNAELTRLLARLPEVYPEVYRGMSTGGLLRQARIGVLVRALRGDVVGDFSRVVWIVAATAALVLLVTCANVANLLLVRAQGRTTDIAVRSALGASRWHLVRSFLLEAGLLAGVGAVIGTALAQVGTRLLVRFGPAGIPRLAEVRVDWPVLAFTALLAALVALACSALPASRVSSLQLGTVLKEGGRSGMSGRERHRTRSMLIAGQVALSLVLLSGAGLLVRTVWRLRDVPLGFDPAHVLTLRVSLPPATYARPADVAGFYDRALERLRELPGVASVGAVSKLPLDGVTPLAPVSVEGRTTPPGTIPEVYAFPVATAEYFRTMGIALVAGRTFHTATDPETLHEILVSRAFAERYWPGERGSRALGQRIRYTDAVPWSTIVGVVESVRDTSLTSAPLAEIYFPLFAAREGVPDSLAPPAPRVMSLVMRTAGDPLGLAGAAQRAIQALDPALPVYDLRAMTEVVSRVTARTSFVLVVLGVGAAITLVLGAVGLYGVIAYMAGLRRREIGVRIALGAPAGDVSRMIVREGMTLAAAGVGVGLITFAALARFLRALLFEVSPADPLTLTVVTVGLLGITGLASWIPARRAGRTDPLEALRRD
jgi:predicted permease